MSATWVYDDGGREAAGFSGHAGDCVVRAAAIISGRPYREIYDLVRELAQAERPRRRRVDAERAAAHLRRLLPPGAEYAEDYAARVAEMLRGQRRSHPRTGVMKPTTSRLMEALGGKWHPTMGIGTGCRVHLRADELPAGRLVANLSRHVAAVVDGIVRDCYDPTRGGTRCVYGYWTFPPLRKPEPLARVGRAKTMRRQQFRFPGQPRPHAAFPGGGGIQ